VHTVSVFRNTIGNISSPTITSFTPSSGLTGTSVTITGTNFDPVSANNIVRFNGAVAIVTTSTVSNITTTVPVGATTGTIEVTVGCNTATSSTNFTICNPPPPPGTISNSRCGNGTVTITASGTVNGNYRWYDVATGGAAISGELNSSFTTPLLTATTTYYVSILIGSCESARVAVTATINTLPASPSITGAASCGASSLTLSASGGTNGQYRWYTVATGGTAITGETNSSYISQVITITTTYFVAINNGTCESLRASVIATINTPPVIPTITSNTPVVGNALTICSTISLTLTAPVGFASYNWSTGATTQQIFVSTSGNYSVTVTDAGGCVSPASAVLVVTVITAPCNNQAPVISTTATSTVIGGLATINLLNLISDADNNLVLSSLAIAQQPTSGASATLVNGVLEIDYKGVSFSGRDQLTIAVCDVFGACTQQVLEIEVIGDIEIYNGISPNGDEQNDIFLIQNIDILPDTQNNRVTIFNRWGDTVWEGKNYDNSTVVFKGWNKNGNELPSGTYFYKVEFTGALPPKTGYLALNR